MVRAMRQVRRGRPMGERAQPLPRHVFAVHDTDRPFRPRARARHGAAIRGQVRVETGEVVPACACACATVSLALARRMPIYSVLSWSLVLALAGVPGVGILTMETLCRQVGRTS